MVKEIERAGIPVVHMCTVVPISLTVGANRIVPTVAIPHPLGNPALTSSEERALRRGLVERALKALTTPVSGQQVFDSRIARGEARPGASRACRAELCAGGSNMDFAVVREASYALVHAPRCWCTWAPPRPWREANPDLSI